MEPMEVLERLKTRFVDESVVLSKYVVARELHKDGEMHIHCYLKYSDKLHLRKSTCFDIMTYEKTYHGNYQTARSAKDVIKYCTKNGVYITNIQDEIDDKRKKEDKAEAIKALMAGDIQLKEFIITHPSLQLIGSYTRLKANLTALRLDLKPLPRRAQVCGKWLIGPPGVGKSHFARTVTKGDLFVKLQTKWWCGYAGQKYVLLEDLSLPGPHSALDVRDLGYFLKLWTDKWNDLVGETKGGANVPLVYSSFWVSSNYTIDEVFEGLNDAALLAAIKRRFVIIAFAGRDDIAEIEKPDGYEDSVTQTMIENMDKKPLKSPDPLPSLDMIGGSQPSQPSFPFDDRNWGEMK